MYSVRGLTTAAVTKTLLYVISRYLSKERGWDGVKMHSGIIEGMQEVLTLFEM